MAIKGGTNGGYTGGNLGGTGYGPKCYNTGGIPYSTGLFNNRLSYDFRVSNTTIFSFGTTDATLAATNGLAITSSTGGVINSGATRQIFGNSSGLILNTPTGTAVQLVVNGSAIFGAQANGLYFYTDTGSPPSGQIGLNRSSSVNLIASVPTGGSFWVNYNNSIDTGISTASILFGFNGQTSTINSSYNVIARMTGGSMGYNAPAGSHIWHIAGSQYGALSSSLLTLANTDGIYMAHTGGTITAANRQYAGTSTGLNYNVPTSLAHTFLANNVTHAVLNASGVRVPNALQFLGTTSGGSAMNLATITSNNVIVYGPNGTSQYTIAAAGTQVLFANTVKGVLIIYTDTTGEYALYHLDGAGSGTAFSGSSVFVIGTPASDKIGIDNSGGNYRINNNSRGSRNFYVVKI